MNGILMWVQVWLEKGTPTVTKGRNSLSSDVHFRPFLTPCFITFSYLIFVLSCPVFVLFCLVLADRQSDKRTDRCIDTHDQMKENG
jgi:hypothetical protein